MPGLFSVQKPASFRTDWCSKALHVHASLMRGLCNWRQRRRLLERPQACHSRLCCPVECSLSRTPTTRRLVQEGKAYPCFCTDEEVTQMKAQAEAESRPPIYTGKWAHASAEEVEQEKAKVRAAE